MAVHSRFVLLLLIALVGGCHRPRAVVDVPAPAPESLPASSAARLASLLERTGATSAASADRDALSASAFVELGHACLSRGFEDCAIAAYGNAAALDQESTDALVYEAIALSVGGRPSEATERLERAAELAPEDPYVALRLAETLAQVPDTEGARRSFEDLLRSTALPPAVQAAARYGLGQTLLEADPEGALTHFDAALELAPDATVIEHQRATALRRLERPLEAQAALARADKSPVPLAEPRLRELEIERVRAAFDALRDLASAPQPPPPEVLLGFADAQFGERPDAVAELGRQIDQAESLPAPTAARLQWVVGAQLERGGRRSEALARFSRALELDPSLDAARIRLAQTQLRLGDAAAARASLDQVLSEQPSSAPALAARAEVELAAGQLDRAATDLERVIALEPRDGPARLRLGELRERAGRAEEAAALYESAIELTTAPRQRATALYRLARLSGAGSPAQTAQRLRQAIAADPSFLDPQLALGGLLLDSGQVDQALEVWKVASTHAPESPVPHRAASAALFLAGRFAEGASTASAALEDFPADPQLLAILARHLAACPERAQRDGARALELARRALSVEPSIANQETLAMALAETGDYAAAVDAQERALAAIPAGEMPVRRVQLEANLALYRVGQPCCAGRAAS